MIFPAPHRFFSAALVGWWVGVGRRCGLGVENAGVELGILVDLRFLFLYRGRHHAIFGERDMAFQSNGLRDAFEGQGDAGFVVYSYATFDPLEAVTAPGYFSGCKRLAVGDLIFVGTRPRPVTSAWMAAQKQTPIRRALLMVADRDEWGRIKVRLVQDYGGPNDGNASIGGGGPSDGNGPMVGCVPANGGDAPMLGDALLGAPAAPPVKRGRGRPRKHS